MSELQRTIKLPAIMLTWTFATLLCCFNIIARTSSQQRDFETSSRTVPPDDPPAPLQQLHIQKDNMQLSHDESTFPGDVSEPTSTAPSTNSHRLSRASFPESLGKNTIAHVAAVPSVLATIPLVPAAAAAVPVVHTVPAAPVAPVAPVVSDAVPKFVPELTPEFAPIPIDFTIPMLPSIRLIKDRAETPSRTPSRRSSRNFVSPKSGANTPQTSNTPAAAAAFSTINTLFTHPAALLPRTNTTQIATTVATTVAIYSVAIASLCFLFWGSFALTIYDDTRRRVAASSVWRSIEQRWREVDWEALLNGVEQLNNGSAAPPGAPFARSAWGQKAGSKSPDTNGSWFNGMFNKASAYMSSPSPAPKQQPPQQQRPQSQQRPPSPPPPRAASPFANGAARRTSVGANAKAANGPRPTGFPAPTGFPVPTGFPAHAAFPAPAGWDDLD